MCCPADNNYFFEPAAAIMYVVFVSLVAAAAEWLRRSALISLLVTQVFLLAASQFAAIAGLRVDPLLLGVVSSGPRTADRAASVR